MPVKKGEGQKGEEERRKGGCVMAVRGMDVPASRSYLVDTTRSKGNVA